MKSRTHARLRTSYTHPEEKEPISLSLFPPNMVVTKGGGAHGMRTAAVTQLRTRPCCRARKGFTRTAGHTTCSSEKKTGQGTKNGTLTQEQEVPQKGEGKKTLIQVKIFVAEARNTKISQSQISFSRIFVWEDTLVDRKYRGRGSGGKHRSFFWQWDGLDIMRSFKWKVTGWIIPYREKKLVAVCINVMHIRLLLSFLPGG